MGTDSAPVTTCPSCDNPRIFLTALTTSFSFSQHLGVTELSSSWTGVKCYSIFFFSYSGKWVDCHRSKSWNHKTNKSLLKVFYATERTDTKNGKIVTSGPVMVTMTATEFAMCLASLPASHSFCRASLGGGCYFKPCCKVEETGEPGHWKTASDGMSSKECGH